MKRFLRAAIGLIGLAAAGSAMAAPKRVAIGSFGPHESLSQVVEGFKQALAENGFAGDAVTYEYSDCNFDAALIPQVLGKLEAGKPDLLMTITTPMTQASVKLIRDQSLPIVFAAVTDPVASGLVPSWDKGSARYVGASNMQDMPAVIGFAKTLLGSVKSYGMLFNPGDANDVVSKNIAEAAAKQAGVEFKAVSVDTVNDIQARAASLAGTDFIYVSPSNLIMPALPAVGTTGDRLKIPLIISSPPGVLQHVALASYSVSWTRVGYNAGLMASKILKGAKTSELANYKPTAADHTPMIDAKRLKQMGKTLPPSLADCKCLVE